jgi:hypothetical protein
MVERHLEIKIEIARSNEREKERETVVKVRPVGPGSFDPARLYKGHGNTDTPRE